MKIFSFFLILYIGLFNSYTKAWSSKVESGSYDASSSVLYGKTAGGVLVPFQVDSDGKVVTSGGGGGTPGGSNPQLQYNNLGAFGGVSGSGVDSNGNVGIGSAVPGQTLDVAGTIRTTNFILSTSPSSGYVLTTNSVGVGTWAASSSGGGTVNSGTANQVAYYATSTNAVSGSNNIQLNGNNVGVGSATPGQILDVQGSVRILGGGSLGIGTSNLSTSALTVMSGNVGIGTWVPATTFEISGTGFRYNGVTYTGTTGTATLVGSASPTFTGSVATPTIKAGTTATGSLTIVATSSSSPTAASGLRIDNTQNAGQVNGMWLDNNSNIGIGTVGPQVMKLAILGNVGIGTSLNGDLFLRTSPPNGGMIIEGNVGVGTLTPGVQLDVQGSLRLNGTGPGSFRIQSSANQACTTTCTTGKALLGLDQGTLGAVLPSLVGPSDTTADQCVCGS